MTTCFTHNRFHQLCNCHTRWNSMRIHNNIWDNSIFCKGHILVPIYHTNSSFLCTTAGTFIANFRFPIFTDTNFTKLIAFTINTIIIHINIAIIICFHCQATILICNYTICLLRHNFAYNYIISINICVFRYKSVVI